MRRFRSISIALALGLVALIPLGTAQAQRPLPAPARPYAGQVVTMYAGNWSPVGNNNTSASHPRVYRALAVLAQRFQQQTGIQIKFVDPGFNIAVDQNGLDELTHWYQTNIAANTAPDVSIVGNIFTQAAYGWFSDLGPYLDQPDPFIPGNKHWSDNWYALMNKNQALDNHGHRFYVPEAGAYPSLIVGIMANSTLLSKAGVGAKIPTEWSDWMAQLAALKAKGIYAASGETSHSGAVASSWPLWSELWTPYMGYLYPKVELHAPDPTYNTAPTSKEIATAIKNGVISASNPRFQAVFRQVKRYMSYWIPGWQTTDVESLWTQGKLAERQFFVADLYTELSDPNRHFPLISTFPPIPGKKTAAGLLEPFGNLPTGAAARQARAGEGNDNVFALIDSAVKRDGNAAAAVKWLQYITAPAEADYVVNEHADQIPVAIGTHMAPIFAALNNKAVPDFRLAGGTYPFGVTAEATPNMEKEIAVWTAGQEDDKTFFAHIETILMTSARTYLANAK